MAQPRSSFSVNMLSIGFVCEALHHHHLLLNSSLRLNSFPLCAAGEMLSVALPFLARNVHPRVLVGAYMKAMVSLVSRIAIAKLSPTSSTG